MNQKDSNVIYIEAEQAILNKGDLIQDCTFPAEYFGKREHQLIYQAIKEQESKLHHIQHALLFIILPKHKSKKEAKPRSTLLMLD